MFKVGDTVKVEAVGIVKCCAFTISNQEPSWLEVESEGSLFPVPPAFCTLIETPLKVGDWVTYPVVRFRNSPSSAAQIVGMTVRSYLLDFEGEDILYPVEGALPLTRIEKP